MENPAPGRDPIDVISAREGYDRWAAIYDSEENPLVALEEPVVAGLLGDVRGLAIADVGCGTGRHALRLAGSGARVTALDFSDEMLAHARRKAGGLPVTFIRHDVEQPLPLRTAAFDRVVCGLVLEHITELGPFFRELGRICRPEGWIVVSAMHPAMMLRGITARFTDPATGRETRPRSYPHQLCDFVMAAVRAGLGIEHFSEHAVDDALAERIERARKYLGWPLLAVLKLRPNSP